MDQVSAPLLPAYTAKLLDLAATASPQHIRSEWWNDASSALNGQLETTVQAALSLSPDNYDDAFFSGKYLASQLVQPFFPSNQMVRILDPACGTGDLLAAAAWHLPLSSSAEETIRHWGTIVAGVDLQEEFLSLARARLAMIAIVRHGGRQSLPRAAVEASFPNMVLADGLNPPEISHPTLLLMNPPFRRVLASDTYTLGSGRISQAALFLDAYLRALPAGSQIGAILPDVIRSGSNYRKLRASIEARGQVTALRILGSFGPSVDVDVFMLHMNVGAATASQPNWWESAGDSELGDFFQVSVGSVVPHRDTEDGDPMPFLNTRAVPKTGAFNSDTAPERRYRGRHFDPPFAVVRRTSSPSDHPRISCTIVEGSRPVTVENHLIVLVPTSEYNLNDLQAVLHSARTASWLNQRLRCRHLTVRALREIPWVSDA